MKKTPHRLYLREEQIPTHYYNLRADMNNKPAPLLRPDNLKPVCEGDLEAVFSKEMVRQELDDQTAYIPIPEAVMDFYRIYRPSPLVRAYGLEKALDTPARIYYKYEGNNTSGSHKLNSAVAQAYYAKAQGIDTLTTETGAGQWGTALAEACAYFDLKLQVFMVKCSYEQKPFRRQIMNTFDASVTASPSDQTQVGRQMLTAFPNSSGSLGTAISEAVEVALQGKNSRYALGSVLNQVLLHQSIIGLESETALQELGEVPDILIGCAGGGSNLGGLIAPFMRDKIQGKLDARFIAVEPLSCPSMTRGTFAYDFCDTGKVTPLAKMYTLGSEFIPSPDHAGGLRFHGMSPLLSQLYHDGFMEASALPQQEIFEAALLFSKVETILPAPESAHAIAQAIREAKIAKEEAKEKVILFGLTGTGFFDMMAYQAFLSGQLKDCPPTEEALLEARARLPQVSL